MSLLLQVKSVFQVRKVWESFLEIISLFCTESKMFTQITRIEIKCVQHEGRTYWVGELFWKGPSRRQDLLDEMKWFEGRCKILPALPFSEKEEEEIWIEEGKASRRRRSGFVLLCSVALSDQTHFSLPVLKRSSFEPLLSVPWNTIGTSKFLSVKIASRSPVHHG